MIDHSLVTGFTMFIRRSFDMTCFGISTYHRHEPPLHRCALELCAIPRALIQRGVVHLRSGVEETLR